MHFNGLKVALLRTVLAGVMAFGFAPEFVSMVSTASAANPAPSTIRVGRNCSCRSCSTVVTVSMETYVKRVLPHEWIPSWHAESLKAGAIAIRSYGAWHVYNPAASNYDICDTTCCQVYSTTHYASTDAAVNATAGIYLVNSSNNIMRAEYSAENNDSGNRDGCGNCYTTNRPSDGICLSDSVCCGTTQNGHGRGMCQWGSQRWASSRGMSYQWIISHYYSAFGWTAKNLTGGGGGPVTITVDNAGSGFSASSNWSTATSAADKFGTNYRFRSTAAVSDAASFTANIPTAGNYTISAWWSQGGNRSATAPYMLPSGGGTVSVNQRTNGGKWNSLGTVNLTTGNKSVNLSCWTSPGYVVIADAVRFHKP